MFVIVSLLALAATLGGYGAGAYRFKSIAYIVSIGGSAPTWQTNVSLSKPVLVKHASGSCLSYSACLCDLGPDLARVSVS